MFKKNIIIALILFYVNTYSQDIAFTQSFMVPETINPSFSGFNGSTKIWFAIQKSTMERI